MILETSILVAIIIGINVVLKKYGVQSRILPVIALVLGIGLAFLAKYIGVEFQEILVSGIVAGLTASGSYDVIKKTVLGK